jgi:hypothetical protein
VVQAYSRRILLTCYKDTHVRVGGAIGSELQKGDCPKQSGQLRPTCQAASLLMHFTPTSSAYLENVWVWVADHDLDVESQDQIVSPAHTSLV